MWPARHAFLLLGMWIGFSGCAKTSDPENLGGEILAMPERCEFRISGDGKWLLTVGEESPHLKPDAKTPSRQRQTFLTDLETGETWFAEPDADVRKRIAEGLGPDGLGCFSPDARLSAGPVAARQPGAQIPGRFGVCHAVGQQGQFLCLHQPQ